MNIFSKILDLNAREVGRLQKTVDKINSFESKYKKYKDSDFSKETERFKKLIASGQSLETILPEAYALVREATYRILGKRHYDVQMMAATALFEGRVAEQKTGEGKTLSAVPALYLRALTGRGVHLVTVNDYLARRDAGWNGPVFHLLWANYRFNNSGNKIICLRPRFLRFKSWRRKACASQTFRPQICLCL